MYEKQMLNKFTTESEMWTGYLEMNVTDIKYQSYQSADMLRQTNVLVLRKYELTNSLVNCAINAMSS